MLPQEAAWLDGFWAINNRRDFQRAVKATILAAIPDGEEAKPRR
jgi:hypothetical protein